MLREDGRRLLAERGDEPKPDDPQLD
jgi:hypothetical protein